MLRLYMAAAAMLAFSTVTAGAADSALSPAANAAYLANYAKKSGVVVRPSGLEYRILQSGFGARPGALDIVSVYYKGTLINGKRFDATEPGFPAQFPVNGVIPGWTEALQMMPVGSKWKLFVPSNLAYGDQQAGPMIAPGSTLIFEVELLDIVKPKSNGADSTGKH